jgi:hypothetical protein
MKNTEKRRLRKNWEYAQDLWKRKKKEHNLAGWSMKLFHKMDTAGLCSYNSKIIYLSSYLLRGHNCDKRKVKKTLIHEITHALHPGHSHDRVWKRACKNLGGDARLAVTMVLPNMNWAIMCPGCGWRHETKTKPKYRNLICRTCYNPIKIKYIN